MEASNTLNELVERIRSWIPRRVEAPASTMSRDFWMPDRSCRLCYECESQFTIFNRRHHCRLCGRVFCGKCSFNTLPASVDGLQGVQSEEGDRVRVCNFCYNNCEQAKQASTPNGQTPTLTPSSSGRSLASSATGAGAPVVSTIAPEQTLSGGSSNRQLFPDVAHDASPGKKHKMRKYQDGSRVHGSISPRARDQPPSPGIYRSDDYDEKENYEGEQSYSRPNQQEDDIEVYSAAELDQELGSKSRDNERKSSSSNYSSQSSMGHRSTVSDDGAEGLKRTESSIYGKEDESVDEVGYADAIRPEETAAAAVDYQTNDEAWYPPPSANPDQEDDDDVEDDVGTMIVDDDEDDEDGPRSPGSASSVDFRREKTASEEHRKAMRAQVDGHFRALVAQFLYQEFLDIGEPGDPDSWLEIVSSLSWQAASYVKPDKGGGMDPGGYVKVKCIASGKKSDSVIVKGVVCRKNVAHRRMTSKFKNPRVLLLGGALEYQRVSNQLSSLDTLLQQEKDHLSMTVARIEAHHPNVLLVEKTVSRYAQDTLLNKEITLVLNVKKTVLERIARCIGAQVAGSPDNLLKVKLGYCENFKVEKYTEEHGSAGQQGKQTTKHLMFFENCPRPQGCTVLLKGANGDELKKVKTVMNLTVFAAYHLALETSFLADEGATVPDLPAQSPISIPRSSSKLNVEKSGAAAPGFVMPPPVRTHVPDPQSQQGRAGQGMNLSVSPLPVRTGSLGTPGAFNAFDNGNPTTPVTVPFSASSSCVSSATNSTGTSPAQNTTFGFQSGMVRGGTTGGTSVSTFHIANGVYPGGQSRQGVSGLSVYLKKGSSEGVENGTSGYEGKASDGNVALPDSERTIGEKGTVSDGGANTYQGVSEDVGRHLTVDVQDSWQCEMQMSTEDFPPADHQNKSILVQLSSRCLKKRNVCKPPHFLRMQFYGNADKPLGSFLRDSLFDTSQKCVQCDEPVNAHVYCFTHHQGSLTISVRRMKDDFVLPGERDGKIWMWHRCLKCPPVNGVPPATPRVVMSDAAWGLSFGKFLELSFSNHEAASRVAACGHSLHRHFLRFYGFGSMVACFQYAEIKLNSVYLPPLQLDFSGPQQEEWLKKEVEEVSLKMDTQYYDVLNKLGEFGEKVASSSSKVIGGTHEVRKSLAFFQEILLKERTEFKEILERACPTTRLPGQHYADILQLNLLRRQLLISQSVWENRLTGLQSAMASKKRYTGSVDDAGLLIAGGSVSVKTVEGPGRDSSVNEPTPNTPTKTGDGGPILRSNTGSNVSEATSSEDEFNTEYEANVSGDLRNERDPPKSEELADANGLDFRLEKEDSTLTSTHPGSSDANLLSDQNLSSGDSTAVMGNSAVSVPASVEGSFLDTDGSPSAESEEPDRATPRVISIPAIDLADRRALSEGSYPLLADLSGSLSPWSGEVNADEKQKLDLSTDQVVEGGQTDEVGNAEDLLRESHGLDRATSGVDSLEAGSASPEKAASADAQPSIPTSPVKALQKPKESADEVPGSSNKTFSRTSSNISTASDVPGWPPQGLQLLDGDPRVLLPPGHEDVVVAVYDEEATSLIAYAISTKEHYAHVTDIPVEREKAKEREERDLIERQNSEQMFHPLQQSGGASDNESSSKASASFFEQAVAKLEEIENPLTSTKASQMVKKTINFWEDSPQGKVKFSVACYFAKQFDALRKKCCKGNTEYVRSLSRCKKWGAQGGKSNVFFAKTADDRFVVKQVTRTELNSFLDFAPAYFKYLFEALTTGNPTCLAKILGVYEVKVTRGSRETKMDVIVMENLLFGRKISRLYDLKGSKRSRYNTDTSGTNQVLLDSNLLEAMPTSPIFVGNKAKRLLERAVWNDTHFLSLVFVMDYSLLVGVDEERKELVVGIIDFMRQYTWDKHLETWVKASGILGGPKDAAPTVISPKQYKKRFRKAMSTYFLMVPDVWVPAQSAMPLLGDCDEKGTSFMAKDDDGGEDSITPRA